MANEATLKRRDDTPRGLTVLDNPGIEKGSILKLVDAGIASGTVTGDNAPAFAGIAHKEKIAGDGRTQLAVHRPGSGSKFDLYCAGPVTLGQPVVISGANAISGAGDSAAFPTQWGKALETGSAGETIEVEI